MRRRTARTAEILAWNAARAWRRFVRRHPSEPKRLLVGACVGAGLPLVESGFVPPETRSRVEFSVEIGPDFQTRARVLAAELGCSLTALIDMAFCAGLARIEAIETGVSATLVPAGVNS